MIGYIDPRHHDLYINPSFVIGLVGLGVILVIGGFIHGSQMR
jgi:hypothetical protein